MMEIRPGIHWIKSPIPLEDSSLSHVNIYLIRGKDGYLIVDTGWNTDASFATLHNYLVKNDLSFGDIAQILVTHIHPDHYGMAGRLKQLSGATIAMHHIEKDFIESRYVSMEQLLQETDRMLVANGVPEREMVSMRDATVGLGQYIIATPPDILLRDGDTVSTGEFTFSVIWTPGHSSGHICLYEPEKKVLCSGDHILPKITPNVSLNPQSIENPLGRYIKSLEEIKKLDIELTLPGHDQPFTHTAERIDEIIRHHGHRNEEILRAIEAGPRTAYHIARKITWSDNSGWGDLPPLHQRMAIFETLAHLEMMATESRVDRLPHEGIIYYRKK
jgi:glyoxylase-like metal-dependent hydrolase (beta-lactamase superfamily II)